MRRNALSVGFDFTKSGLEVLGTKLCKILIYQRLSMQLSGSCCHRAVSQTATVKMVVRGESGNRVCVSFCMTARDECVCVCVLYSLSKLMEQRRKTTYSRTRHSPSLRSNLQQFRWTHSTWVERERVISCCIAWNRISDSESENSVRALRPRQEEDQMKIIGEEKLLLMFAHVFLH